MNIKCFKYTIFLFVLFLFACQYQDELTDAETSKNLVTDSLSQIKEQVFILGFDTTGICFEKNGVIVENDIILTKQYLLSKETLTRQYRTNNYVANNTAITIGPSPNLKNNDGWVDAIKSVIGIYNQSTGLHFIYSENSPRITVVKTKLKDATICGQGVFPTSSNAPGNYVYINNDPNLDIDKFLSHSEKVFLLMHEVGHNLGLRHTDAKNKGEKSGKYGLVQIPHTPEKDSYSFMNSGTCGFSWTDFTKYDKIALKELWPIICYINFYSQGKITSRISFAKGDSISIIGNNIPDAPDVSNVELQFNGWFYDSSCTHECVYGTFIASNTDLYASWRTKGKELKFFKRSQDEGYDYDTYFTLEKGSVVNVSCKVNKGLNSWYDVRRWYKETGVLITSENRWPNININYWMEDEMYLPETSSWVTKSWNLYIPAGKYKFNALFAKSLGHQNYFALDKHGSAEVTITCYN